MLKMNKNIIFIGMSGAGKTTIAKKLSKKINFDYFDLDDLIEEKMSCDFQTFIDKYGSKNCQKFEEKIASSLKEIKKTVIATGGSVVYSKKAMLNLKKLGILVYLDVPFKYIDSRLKDRDRRGIIWLKEKGLKKLYYERKKLYLKYADILIKLKGNEKKVVVMNKVLESIIEKE